LPCPLHTPPLNNPILQPKRASLLLGSTQIHDRLILISNLERETKIYREFGTRAFIDR
jgi:hypothetical protein